MNPSSHACLWKCYNLVKQMSVCIFDHYNGFLPIFFHTHFIIPLPFLSQMCLILPPPLLQLSLPLLSLLILILTNCHLSDRSYLPLSGRPYSPLCAWFPSVCLIPPLECQAAPSPPNQKSNLSPFHPAVGVPHVWLGCQQDFHPSDWVLRGHSVRSLPSTPTSTN